MKTFARLATLSLFPALLLAPAASRAQNAPNTPNTKDDCSVDTAAVDLNASIQGTPSYFAKATLDGKYMGFISEGNYVMDLSHPKTLVHVPGPYDPVPSADGKYFLIPVDDGMSFFPVADIERLMKPDQTVEATDLKPKYTDTDLGGNYQSSGVLSKDFSGSEVLRVDVSGMSYADYKIDSAGNISRIGKVHKLCSNIKLEHPGEDDDWDDDGALRLPMLSKDGSMVAAYNSDSNTTKIYKIDGENCEELVDLGVPTGKVEFNYSGTQIAFHVDTFSDESGEFFSGVGDGELKNVYVADLDTNETGKLKIRMIRRLTNNIQPGDGSYYPSFTRDGKVAFVNGQNGSYSFQIVDPYTTRATPYLIGDGTTPAVAAYALGDLWSKVCGNATLQKLSPKEATYFAMSLSQKACWNLVQDKWEAWKDKIASDKLPVGGDKGGAIAQAVLGQLGMSDILAACPRSTRRDSTGETLNDEINLQSQLSHALTGEQVFNNRCEGCHDSTNGAAPHIDWNNLSPTLMSEMIQRVTSSDPAIHMPPNTQLNQEFEVQPLVNTLEQKGGSAN